MPRGTPAKWTPDETARIVQYWRRSVAKPSVGDIIRNCQLGNKSAHAVRNHLTKLLDDGTISPFPVFEHGNEPPAVTTTTSSSPATPRRRGAIAETPKQSDSRPRRHDADAEADADADADTDEFDEFDEFDDHELAAAERHVVLTRRAATTTSSSSNSHFPHSSRLGPISPKMAGKAAAPPVAGSSTSSTVRYLGHGVWLQERSAFVLVSGTHDDEFPLVVNILHKRLEISRTYNAPRLSSAQRTYRDWVREAMPDASFDERAREVAACMLGATNEVSVIDVTLPAELEDSETSCTIVDRYKILRIPWKASRAKTF